MKVLWYFFFNKQIDWDLYFSEVFQNTNVFVNDDEKIIVREPEYFDALLPILAATPKRTIGEYTI